VIRAFFALPIGDELREALIAAQARMRRADATGRLPIRFSRQEQLHVTLKFLGDVPDAAVPALSEIARRRAAEHLPLTLCQSNVIAFGSPRRARALVAAIDEHPQLLALVAELEADVGALGIPRERRPYRPHVTLVRFKRPGDARALLAAAALEPRDFSPAELRFYQSTLGAQGGVYTVLGAFPFGAP